MYKIIAPEKGYRGVTGGITFINGVATAELDAFTKEWFISKGYEVEETTTTQKVEEPKTKEPEAETPEAGEEKTKAELLEEAKALGIENIRSKATKAEIEKLINDKKIELEALAGEGNSDNETPEAGEAGDEDLEKGE